jgi:hypothetical protein
MEMSGQLSDPAALLQGKVPPIPIVQRLDWLQGHTGYDSEKKVPPFPEIEPRPSSP